MARKSIYATIIFCFSLNINSQLAQKHVQYKKLERTVRAQAAAHNTLKCNLLELCIGIKILLQAICLGEFSRVYTQQKEKKKKTSKGERVEKWERKSSQKGFIQISNYTFYGMVCADAHNTFSSYLPIWICSSFNITISFFLSLSQFFINDILLPHRHRRRLFASHRKNLIKAYCIAHTMGEIFLVCNRLKLSQTCIKKYFN